MSAAAVSSRNCPMIEFCAFVWSIVGVIVIFAVAAEIDANIRKRREERSRTKPETD